jgi:ribonuclease HI
MSKNKNIYSKDSNRIRVFTDGSSDPRSGLGSWASIILYAGEKKMITGIEENATQHKMELFAVLESLRYIVSEVSTRSGISIYTDSEYVKNLPSRRDRLERNNFFTKKGKPVVYSELIKEFYEYLDWLSVDIIRVKSHQKKGQSEISDYNREVDKLSRKILRKKIRDQ